MTFWDEFKCAFYFEILYTAYKLLRKIIYPALQTRDEKALMQSVAGADLKRPLSNRHVLRLKSEVIEYYFLMSFSCCSINFTCIACRLLGIAVLMSSRARSLRFHCKKSPYILRKNPQNFNGEKIINQIYCLKQQIF